MSYDVFISYSRKDTAVADKIAKPFDDAGITYFIDRQGIEGGMEFPEVLANAILESKVFLFLASENSYDSKFTQSEIVFAFNKKQKTDIIPYIIDNSTLPVSLEFTFASINRRNMRQHPIETIVDDVLQKLGREKRQSAHIHKESEIRRQEEDVRHGTENRTRSVSLREEGKQTQFGTKIKKYLPWIIAGVAFIIVVILMVILLHKSEKDSNQHEVVKEEKQEQESNTVTDIDGNVYKTVKIGKQVWMAENLRTTRYANGESIPLGTNLSEVMPYRYNPITQYSYNPDNNSSNMTEYGYLYNWPAVMHGAESSESNPSGIQGICPDGWHVPSDAEWRELTEYVSSRSEYVCGNNKENIAKALAAPTGWNSNSNECAVGNSPSANNATGFSALPTGHFGLGDDYTFQYCAFYWSTTEHIEKIFYDGEEKYFDYAVCLSICNKDVSTELENEGKEFGLSVRCVRD